MATSKNNDEHSSSENYLFRVIVMFYKGRDYMFEFGHAELNKLFKENPPTGGFPTIKSGLVFKIMERKYQVEDVMFNFYDGDAKDNGFNARIIVNIREVPDVIEPHIELPEEAVKKQK